jgi:acyl-CoA reductase-like NAD-dependent aldehyde dehydrogenase
MAQEKIKGGPNQTQDTMQTGPGKIIPLWIDNQEYASSITFPVINAEKGQIVHDAYGATPELAVRAVESARRAFLSWGKTKPWARRHLLLKAAEYLRERRKQIADLILVS